jgi:hypothetical protein
MARDPESEARFTWNKGDLQLLKPGKGEPLISEEDLDRLLAEGEDIDFPPEEAPPELTPKPPPKPQR